jgi:hypothetical protein
VSTFLLSWLGNRYAALDASIFLREQPGDWLVLEDAPGNPTRTGEPIAIRLALRRDRARFTLGRDPACDFVLDSPSVALTHAVLSPEEDGVWTLRRAGDDTPARLDGLLLGDFPVALGSGARISLGEVQLTYYSAADFQDRLRGAVQPISASR